MLLKGWLNFAQIIFGHYLVCLSESNSQFDGVVTLEWWEQMDLLLVSPCRLYHLSKLTYLYLAKFNHIAAQQLDHQDIVGLIRNLCTDAVTTIKSKLKAQKQSDAAEVRRLEEKMKRRAEEEAKSRADDNRRKHGEERLWKDMAELAAARQQLEEMKRIAEQEMAIILAKHDLKAKQKDLNDTQRSAGIEVDDTDDDDRSDSAPEDQQVRFLFVFSLHSILILLHTSIRGL
jgi:hypothetical protein